MCLRKRAKKTKRRGKRVLLVFPKRMKVLLQGAACNGGNFVANTINEAERRLYRSQNHHRYLNVVFKTRKVKKKKEIDAKLSEKLEKVVCPSKHDKGKHRNF